MRILIIGSSGFTGNALLRYLRDHHSDCNIRTFDISNDKDSSSFERYTGSILNIEDLRKALTSVDIVFQLAGVIGTTELLWQEQYAIDVNVSGLLNVLLAAHEANVKTIFYPTKPNNWLNIYSITKLAGEGLAQLFAQQRGLDVRILRWLNIYGPGQKAMPVRKCVPIMILQALNNVDIDVWNTGEQLVALSFIDDVLRNTVLYTLLEGQDSRVRDTGNVIPMSVNALADLIRSRCNSTAEIIHHDDMRPGEQFDSTMAALPDCTAADLLGLASATTQLELALDVTIGHYANIPRHEQQQILAYHEREFATLRQRMRKWQHR
jgi:UDP-glucose 4-epimerase